MKNMKKVILAAAVLGTVGFGLQPAKASDLGKFLDGAVAIHEAAFRTLADVVHDVTPRVNVNVGLPPAPVVYATAPRVIYVPAPAPRVVYYSPAPVVYRAPVYYVPRYRGHEVRHDYHGGYMIHDGHRR
jgi:hypothetical protein